MSDLIPFRILTRFCPKRKHHELARQWAEARKRELKVDADYEESLKALARQPAPAPKADALIEQPEKRTIQDRILAEFNGHPVDVKDLRVEGLTRNQIGIAVCNMAARGGMLRRVGKGKYERIHT